MTIRVPPRAIAWVVLLLGVGAASADPPKPVATVTIPLHGAYVSDPVMSAADGKRLEDRVAVLEQRLAELEAASGKPAAAKAPAKPDLLPVAVRHCARCHSPGAAPDRGDGLILFADDAGGAFARPMPAYLQTRVRQTVADGSMPKTGAKPSPAEKALFAQFEVK